MRGSSKLQRNLHCIFFPTEVQLSDMLTELHSVVGWFLLGIHLGVPLSDLQKIRHQFNESVDQCKTEMLITYTKLKEPSWTDIVEALKRSGEHALASIIARKHGKFECQPNHVE